MPLFNIDRDSPVPLYYQLQDSITQQIDNGDYKQGDPLPSEQAIIEDSGLSRTTVRQAIAHLVHKGVLEKRRGVGTFVAKQQANRWELTNIQSFSDELRSDNPERSTRQLSLKLIEADENCLTIFGTHAETIYRLERLRYIHDIPVILSTTYVPEYIAPGMERFDFSKRSLFDVMLHDYRIRLNHAEKSLQATLATPEDAKLLEIDPGSAVQRIVGTTFDDENRAVEFSISRDRGDMSVYKVRLGQWANRSPDEH